jgi:hypothetical protein
MHLMTAKPRRTQIKHPAPPTMQAASTTTHTLIPLLSQLPLVLLDRRRLLHLQPPPQSLLALRSVMLHLSVAKTRRTQTKHPVPPSTQAASATTHTPIPLSSQPPLARRARQPQRRLGRPRRRLPPQAAHRNASPLTPPATLHRSAAYHLTTPTAQLNWPDV